MSKTEINNYFIHLNTKEGLIAASNDGTILDINTAAKKLLGIPDVDIIDSFNFLDSFEFYDLNTFDLLSAQQHPFSIFLKNKSDQEYIVGVKDASGLFIWINCSFTTILDKEQDCTLISLLNYTKIVNQNIQLKKQEHHQNLLVAALNDIVFEISSTGVYINYWTNNPELLFYQPEDFLGKSVYELFPEDMSSKAMYYIHKTLQTRKEQIIPFPSPKDSLQRHFSK